MKSCLSYLAYATTLGSPGYQVSPGFWYTLVRVLPRCLLDIDGNGAVDGLMILRALFGLTGTFTTIDRCPMQVLNKRLGLRR
jgi:hypothetical protein